MEDFKGIPLPPQLGREAGLATVELEQSVRAMLEQILFTEPGERVNRPTFGVGVQALVFEPNTPFLESRVQVALEENVYEHLGQRIRIEGVGVDRYEQELHVRIRFRVEGTVASASEMSLSVPLELPA